VPASAIQPGSYNLSAISAQFGEIYGIAGPSRDQGCTSEPCSMSTKGVGSDAVVEPGAVLEIDSANPQCITGAITGLGDIFPAAPNHNGPFYALSCDQ
jgi:hypothetical protein